MCLTIPKKVIEIKKNSVIVENHLGDRQEIKSLIKLIVGDFVLTQQNIVIEKIKSKYAKEIFDILNKKERE